MYAPQHAAAPRHRAGTGRHRRPSRPVALSPAVVMGGLSPLAGVPGAVKPGPKIATGLSAFTVGAVSLAGMAAPAHADGETLSFRQIAGVVEDVGLPCVSGTAIAYAESGGDTNVNSQFPGEDSRGLFQINEVHGFDFNWDDAYANAQMAKDIYQSAGGWGPWGAYTNGSYQQYVDEASAACDDPSQVRASGNADGADAEPAVYTGKHRKDDGGSTYTVDRGDTLSEIASDRGTTWRHLAQMNPQIDNPDRIYPGQRLDVTGHPVQ